MSTERPVIAVKLDTESELDDLFTAALDVMKRSGDRIAQMGTELGLKAPDEDEIRSFCQGCALGGMPSFRHHPYKNWVSCVRL